MEIKQLHVEWLHRKGEAMARRGLERLSDRAIRANFELELDIAMSKMGWINDVSRLYTSDADFEEYFDLEGAPVLGERRGGNNYVGLSPEARTITNVEYEAGIRLNKKHLRRDKTGLLRQRLGELATRSVTHWSTLLSSLVENGDSTAIGNGSGENFFDTHALGVSTGMINELTASEVSALDVTTATDPTADEMAKCILGIISQFFSWTDERGEPLNDSAQNFVVMTPTSLWPAAMEAVTSKQLDTGSGSRDNVLGAFNVSVAHNARLDAWTTKFAVFNTDGANGALIRQTEVDTEFNFIGPESHWSITNDGQCLAQIEASRAVGYGHWWKAANATLS